MKKTIYEATDPQKLLDTKDGVWRVSLGSGYGEYLGDDKGYERGDVVVFSTETFCDADRAGFSGYLSHTIEIPLAVFMEAADALLLGEIPREEDDN